MKNAFLSTKKSKKFLLFIVPFLFWNSIASASLYYACANLLSSKKVEWLDDKVSILYFPEKMHVKIEVDGKIYNPDGKYLDEGPIRQILYNPLFSSPLKRVRLRITSRELARIVQFVKNPKPRLQTCVSGACRAINSNTGMIIPFPLNQLPMATYFYLKTLKNLGLDRGRIVAIESYWGNGFFSAGHIMELTIVTIIGMTTGLIYHETHEANLRNTNQQILLETAENYNNSRPYLHPFDAVVLETGEILFIREKNSYFFSPEDKKIIQLPQMNENPKRIYWLTSKEGVFLVIRNQTQQYELYKYVTALNSKGYATIATFPDIPFSNGKELFYLDTSGKLFRKSSYESEGEFTGLEGFSTAIYKAGEGWVLQKTDGQWVPVNRLEIP